jgi:dienelactone hydrolase
MLYCHRTGCRAILSQKNYEEKMSMIVYKSMVCKINPFSAVFLLFLFQAGAVHTLISRNGEDRSFDSAGSFSKDTAKDLHSGEIILSVKCTQNPEQSYALYIPLHYEPDKKWPIVYVFDPAAHGSIPVELMKEAAERYGFIIAASNNSRNGPIDLQQKAGQAMWDDTHARLAVDNDCVYFAGFSGGARMAALLAQECACVQGILLNSAGFSPYSPPSAKDRFAVFLTAGMSDFNYDEIIKLEKTLGNLGISHFLRRFNGSHGWAPKDVWQEAFAWMRLAAMKNGRQPRDEKFITTEIDLALRRAQTLEDSGSAYYAWQNYREVSDIFQGLIDTKKIDARTAILENDVKVREGQEQEEKELDEQIKLQNKILSILQLM